MKNIVIVAQGEKAAVAIHDTRVSSYELKTYPLAGFRPVEGAIRLMATMASQLASLSEENRAKLGAVRLFALDSAVGLSYSAAGCLKDAEGDLDAAKALFKERNAKMELKDVFVDELFQYLQFRAIANIRSIKISLHNSDNKSLDIVMKKAWDACPAVLKKATEGSLLGFALGGQEEAVEEPEALEFRATA